MTVKEVITLRLKHFNFLIITLSLQFDISVLKKWCLDIFEILKGKFNLKSLFFLSRYFFILWSENFLIKFWVNLLFTTETIGLGSRHNGSDTFKSSLLSILNLSSMDQNISSSSFIRLAKSTAIL